MKSIIVAEKEVFTIRRRNIYVILLLAITCMILGACANNKDTDFSKNFDFSFMECAGMNLTDTLEKLKIFENQIVEEGPGLYELNEKFLYQGFEFREFLLFMNNENVGGGYVCSLPSKGEELTKLVTSIKQEFRRVYGKSKKQGINGTDFTSYNDVSINEIWELSDENDTITLALDFYDESFLRITYRKDLQVP